VSSPERISALQQDLTSATLTDLEFLVTSQWPENLHWEFKSRGPHPPSDRLSDDERKGLGEIVSGFANSEGGVAIFGIVSKRDGTVDRAYKLEPVEQVQRFADAVATEIDGIVSPRVPDVSLRTVAGDAEGGGFVLIRVPRSERRPHMSRAKSHQRYYYRRSDGFHPMEHFQVEDAFARRGRPALTVTCQRHPLRPQVHIGARTVKARCYWTLLLGNESSVTAEWPGVTLLVSASSRIEACVGYAITHGTPSSVTITANGTHVINPGQVSRVATLELEAERHGDGDWKLSAALPIERTAADCTLQVLVAAKDTPSSQQDIILDLSALWIELAQLG
jgi:hypothetical protein